MTSVGWLQIAIFSLLLILLTKPVGIYMAHVLEDERTPLDFLFHPIEQVVYKFMSVDPKSKMRWTEYGFCLLAFSFVSMLFSYAILRLQGFLPLNPNGFSTAHAPAYATPMTADLAFNTAASFTTNTNWQAYAGESTLSYLSQMLALAMHNWVSAAVGISCAVALARGFARHSENSIGNFWQDLVRTTIYILFPVCFLSALCLVFEGVIQNFSPYTIANALEGAKQILPQGPVASQEAIKMLGTNGGGLFNANSAHPFENPTPLTNFLEMLLIFLIPAGLTYTFGRMVKDTRQGWVLLATMFIFFLGGVGICYSAEAEGNPNISSQNVETASLGDLGGNMEGKEVRFGLAASSLFATVTTDASCGAVNCTHDSLTPLGGLIPLLNIQLGEIVFGGVGSGLYGMLVYAILTVFIAGLMVGRTPEFLGKKIEKREVKLAMLFVLAGAFSILGFTALGSVAQFPVNSYLNPPGAVFNNVNNGGPHGFSEILYAFTSGTGNNGSAFAGLNCNTPFYNITVAIATIVGRFFMITPVLALAGTLAAKKYVPASAGTFPTHGMMFIVLLLSVILIVGALTFFPALTLGPIVEQFLMRAGRLF